MPSLRELQHDFAARCSPATAPLPPFATVPGRPRRRAHRHLPPRAFRQLSQCARRDVSRRATAGRRAVLQRGRRRVRRARIRRRAAISTSTATRSARFSARYPPAAELPYLARRRRLEWAMDEANRAADGAIDRRGMCSPTLAIMRAGAAAGGVARRSRRRAGSSTSRYPILRIWQVEPGGAWRDGERVSLDAGRTACSIRREPTASRSSASAPASTHGSRRLRRSGVARRPRSTRRRTADATFDFGDGAARAHRRRHDRRRQDRVIDV